MKTLINKLKNTGKTIVASAIIAGTLAGCTPPVTPANQDLRIFPTKNIPGIARVEKYETPNANKTIVHVRQNHYVEPPKVTELTKLQRRYCENSLLSVARTQRDICDSVQYLDDIKDITDFYSEGIKKGDGDFSTENAKNYAFYMLEKIEEKGYLEVLSKEDLECFVPGAEYILASAGRVRLKGAEDEDLNKRIMAARPKTDGWGQIQELREDYALETISNSTNDVNYLVYGANHDFRNNVEKWNENNPKEKYSLIVLTPNELRNK